MLREIKKKPREPGFGVIETDGVQVLTWKPGQEPRRVSQKEPPISQRLEEVKEVKESELPKIRHQAPSTLSEVSGSPMGPKGRSQRVQGREVCLGMAYRDEQRVQESPKRGLLLSPRYVFTLNDREGFWRKLHAAASLQKVLECQKLVSLSDGSRYLIERTRELLRGQPLVSILDIQHAKQHVWEAGHQVVSQRQEVVGWVHPKIEQIKEGKVSCMIEELEKEKDGKRGQKRKALEALVGYLAWHKYMMQYSEYREKGYPIASASIESANKRLVSRRCKQGGMIWSETGLSAILALRVAFYNPGEWQTLWPHTSNLPNPCSP